MNARPAPDVSVIVPAWNAADHLAEAVRSALDQSGVAVEVLIVDDASTDDTAKVAAALAATDERVRALSMPRNGGPAAARNLGLAAARGTWVAPLDSDDLFEPGRLAALVAAGTGANADMVADDLLLCEEDGGCAPMLDEAGAGPRLIGLADFLEGNLPIPGRPRVSYGFLKPLVRTGFLADRNLRYEPDMRFAEDFVFYATCLLHGARFRLHPAAGYRYTVRTGGLTDRHGAAELERLLAADRRLIELAGPDAPPQVRRALRRHARSIRDRLCWRRFTDNVKAGRLPAAFGTMLRSPVDAAHILAMSAAALARKGRRQLGSASPR